MVNINSVLNFIKTINLRLLLRFYTNTILLSFELTRNEDFLMNDF